MFLPGTYAWPSFTATQSVSKPVPATCHVALLHSSYLHPHYDLPVQAVSDDLKLVLSVKTDSIYRRSEHLQNERLDAQDIIGQGHSNYRNCWLT